MPTGGIMPGALPCDPNGYFSGDPVWFARRFG